MHSNKLLLLFPSFLINVHLNGSESPAEFYSFFFASVIDTVT